jgi:hypothetical protein
LPLRLLRSASSVTCLPSLMSGLHSVLACSSIQPLALPWGSPAPAPLDEALAQFAAQLRGEDARQRVL